MNPLQQWLDGHTAGPGVWKWRHYLSVYDRYLSKFRGCAIGLCEIGVYSGGSLQMWRDYFGPAAEIHGVDIQPACRKFEALGFKIHIADQGDRNFWREFRQNNSILEVVIDDGSHQPEHQLATMQELLPHLAPGGVYICEDVLLGTNTPFAEYVNDLALQLHENVDIKAQDMLAMGLNETQAMIKSIHTYPHVVVVEKWDEAPARFEAPGYGSEWIWQDPEWRR